ncbi:hypothetical protein ACQKCH_11140 [Nubsella zeaxanthinifaciens]|uniref:hypothetical protein n=1 Tax=Nubsella zeaxanthinifaciens TaxID=392412 RepID=UPI003CFCCE99
MGKSRKKMAHWLVLGMLLLVLAACAGRVENPIEGTYVNHAQSEFSSASDTLVIAKDRGDSYFIKRHTGIRLIDGHGGIGKELLEMEQWRGDYDAGSGILTERSKGRKIAFGKQSLTLESAIYRRLP